MKQVVIENPILNSPFREPARHWRFTDEGITDEIAEGRRVSSYLVPIPPPRGRGRQAQLALEYDAGAAQIQENVLINQIRGWVALWRQRGRPGVTRTTARLLEHWTDGERERALFFCQIEALETAIYLTEVASRHGDAWIENELRRHNESANPLLFRIAFKMATGSGKTVVMAMLIAWHTLNKLAHPQDARFADAFLIVSPGITIRDRLRVLLPSDPQNYYRQLDLAPPELLPELGKAKLVVTNFHAFKPREHTAAGKLTKSLLRAEETGAFTETPEQMVRRVCRELGNKKNLVVINDEAHHCYRRRPVPEEEESLKGEERREAEKREEEARIWISGLEAVKAKLGLRAVYDLSATPFFLKGSGYREGTLFPWVVSDFALIDAIEAGIVKIPRVPVADHSMTGGQPAYRDLFQRIAEELPKKGRKAERTTGEPKLPVALQGALHALYGNYQQAYGQWAANTGAREAGQTPPVFIVVCNNTTVSKLVYDYIAGWEKELADGTKIPVRGELNLFSNVDEGRWSARPRTILIDSEQLESGEGMSDEFKKFAAREIEEFKSEYRARFPDRDLESLTDEDLLREVMNTVGKAGKLGEEVRCVVSVSMLSEGWDAQTVTHILGVRRFGTRLLCEQVIGRGLRRMSYAVNAEGMFEPEYAEVYGVPFDFIPCGGSTVDPPPRPPMTRVRALEERIACEITFPRVVGYRYELPREMLTADFNEESCLALSTADVPTWNENAPIVGQSSIQTLDELRGRRLQEVAFLIAKLVLEKYFRQDGETRTERPETHQFDGEVQCWLFPQLLEIARRWMVECVTCKDNTFPQLLLLLRFAHDAADRIYKAIVRSTEGEKAIMPLLRPYDTVGSTRYVDFDTARPVYRTDPARCHVSHVVADTESWEQKMAQALEGMDEVACYVKNHGLGFTIPYTLDGEERQYVPDYLVRLRNGGELLNLILEVSGEKRRDKAAKTSTARDLWVAAMNNHGGFGRWEFLEITDPWDAENVIWGSIRR